LEFEAGFEKKLSDNLSIKGKYNSNGQLSYGAIWQANDLLKAGFTGTFNNEAKSGEHFFETFGATLEIGG